jgi:hypothetical protein
MNISVVQTSPIFLITCSVPRILGTHKIKTLPTKGEKTNIYSIKLKVKESILMFLNW